MRPATLPVGDAPCCSKPPVSTVHRHGVSRPPRGARPAPARVGQWQAEGAACRRSAAALAATGPAPPAPLPAFNPARADRDLDTPAPGFDSIADAVAAMARGEMVVVLDDEDRENEGDLIMAADHATPARMAFIVQHTSGVVCVGMEGAALDRLRVPLMVPQADNDEALSTAFTVTVDLAVGTTTGISAADRAATVKALADPASQPADFKRPGHIFPLRYRQGGVLRRPGHTEAAVDLSRMAGCNPAGVLCEIVAEDGSMARTPELLRFAARHGLKCITIADMVRYRLRHERLVERAASAPLPTRYGAFQAHAYRALLDGTEHMVLVAGDVGAGEGVLVRVHSEGMLGDIFGSERCNSGSQLDGALRQIAAAGRGVLVYLRGQQGRGLGVAEELQAYADDSACGSRAALEDAAFPADLRDYGAAAHMLRDLGVRSVRLLTNNATKSQCLRAHGIQVLEQVPLLPEPAGGEVLAAAEGQPVPPRVHGAVRSRGAEAEHFA